MSRLLLDTCALVHLGTGTLPPDILTSVLLASFDQELFVSVMAAMELAQLQHRRRLRVGEPADRWYARVLGSYAIRELRIGREQVFGAYDLPPPWPIAHKDPADRVMAATARLGHLALVTCDTKLTALAGTGLIDVMAYPNPAP